MTNAVSQKRAESLLTYVPGSLQEGKEIPGPELRSADEQRVRVLQVGNFLSQRGYTRQFVEELSDRLEQEGWNIIRASDRANKVARLGSIVRRIVVDRNRFDIAHITVYSGTAFLWAETAAMILALMRKPFVLSLHGGNLPSFAARWPGRVRRLLLSADVVIAPSGYMRDAMLKFRKDISLIANPVDTRLFAYRHRELLRPRLVWLRSFHETYNPALAAQILSLLVSEFPDMTLTMAGPDKGDGSFQRVKETARELGVERNIVFTGRLENKEVPGFLSNADLFVNTTNVDNTPISILEAMACGLCVVTTNVGGIPYLLENDHEALLVEPNDAARMAGAIRRILTEPDLARRLSQNARRKAEQCDWSNIMLEWKRIFTSLHSNG
ncbi:MAG: glycosyltransferase family 4 protein [Bacteroidetes bacterium]|nr:glycosyltransferase family 4 protein [Bacteroidota bacterium]MCW5897459.1 glycosyltransferase family 4 protein [Bacteroidota bacterium]